MATTTFDSQLLFNFLKYVRFAPVELKNITVAHNGSMQCVAFSIPILMQWGRCPCSVCGHYVYKRAVDWVLARVQLARESFAEKRESNVKTIQKRLEDLLTA